MPLSSEESDLLKRLSAPGFKLGDNDFNELRFNHNPDFEVVVLSNITAKNLIYEPTPDMINHFSKDDLNDLKNTY